MAKSGAKRVPQSTGELRGYFDAHPERWAALVGVSSLATGYFAWRSTRAKKDKGMVRNGMAMAVMGLEVWGLVQMKRGAPIAIIAEPASSTASGRK